MNMNDRDYGRSHSGTIACGFALVAIGGLLLMKNAGFIWVRVSDLWPIALIAIGIEGLFTRRRGENR